MQECGARLIDELNTMLVLGGAAGLGVSTIAVVVTLIERRWRSALKGVEVMAASAAALVTGLVLGFLTLCVRI